MMQQLIIQFKGIINLSIPLIAIVLIKPNIFRRFSLVALCSILMGFYITYLNYTVTKNHETVLSFIPSGESKETFNQLISQCKLRPEDVRLRYGYADDAVAMTIFNTIKIDPLMWKNVDTDPEVVKIKKVLHDHVLPGVPEDKKNLHAQINVSLTPPAQQFIFKHELGHVFYNYSAKKLSVLFLIGTLVTLSGISTAITLAPFTHGVFAIVSGMFAAGFTDLFLTYSSNVFFKYYQEKKADLFASKYSSQEEINAAADFFEKYQEYAHEYRKPTGLASKIPQAILSGHPDGKSRASYLRNIAAKTSNT